MTRCFYPLLFSIFLVLTALTACCPFNKQLVGDPQSPYPLRSTPNVGQILHMPTGILVSQKELAAAVADTRIVYFGETHDNPASHKLELNLLQSLSKFHPQHQALGMEMFVRSQQPVLDRWVAGKLDEEEFLRESRWFENWKTDFAYYRDLLNFARDYKIPIIALNAEKEQVDAVRARPIDQLSLTEKSRLPEMDMTDQYHRAMITAFFSGHTHSEMQLDGFIRAQTLWDETMAESTSRFLSGPEGKDMHLLVIAGGNHVEFGFGIPRRAFRRFPASYILIGGQEINISKDKESQLMNVTLPDFPMVPFDFLAYIDYEELTKIGVHLGVMIEPKAQGGGLVIKGIIPNSIAEHSGLKKEDLLLSLDGKDLKDNIDLIYVLKKKHQGDRLTLKVDRNGKIMIVDIIIASSEEKDHQGK